MELSLFLIFIAVELFETNWQKSDTLFGLINNNFLVFRKNMFLYFFLHPSFFYIIFIAFYLNNFGFLISSILILKFLDIGFKLSLMKNLSDGKTISEIIPMDINITPIIRYFNVIVYPLTFLFATAL